MATRTGTGASMDERQTQELIEKCIDGTRQLVELIQDAGALLGEGAADVAETPERWMRMLREIVDTGDAHVLRQVLHYNAYRVQEIEEYARFLLRKSPKKCLHLVAPEE